MAESDPERSLRESDLTKMRKALAGAVGKRGSRKLDKRSDNARTSVKHSVERAKEHIRKAIPELASHLDTQCETGTTCMYKPTNPPISWET